MNYIDLIVIVFIGLIVFEGFKKGFVKMVFEFVGLIVAFFASKQYSFIIEEFIINKTKMYEIIHDFFQNKAQWLTEIIQDGTADVVNNLQEALQLPQEMKMLFIQSYEGGIGVGNFDVFVNVITDFVIKSIGFLITFLIVYLILLIICNVINAIVKLPLLNITNKLGGSVVGFAKGVITLYIVFALASPVIAFIPNNKFVENIHNSTSGKIFYDNNIILNYLSYKGFYDDKKE